MGATAFFIGSVLLVFDLYLLAKITTLFYSGRQRSRSVFSEADHHMGVYLSIVQGPNEPQVIEYVQGYHRVAAYLSQQAIGPRIATFLIQPNTIVTVVLRLFVYAPSAFLLLMNY